MCLGKTNSKVAAATVSSGPQSLTALAEKEKETASSVSESKKTSDDGAQQVEEPSATLPASGAEQVVAVQQTGFAVVAVVTMSEYWTGTLAHSEFALLIQFLSDNAGQDELARVAEDSTPSPLFAPRRAAAATAATAARSATEVRVQWTRVTLSRARRSVLGEARIVYSYDSALALAEQPSFAIAIRAVAGSADLAWHASPAGEFLF